MNIIFFGAVVPPEQIPQMSGLSVAGNKFQYNIIKYLARHKDVHIHVLSVLPLAPFPYEKRIVIRKNHRLLWKNVEYIEIPYVNIPIVKQLMQIRGFISCAKHLVDSDSVLLSMNLFPFNGCAFVNVRKRYGCRGVAILADLPIDENYARKGLSKAFRYLYDRITIWNIKKCRDFIVLNETAAKEYTDDASNYIVMEGGLDLEEVRLQEKCRNTEMEEGKKRIVYSGALSDYSGIMELMEAMKYVTDDNIVLEIYGRGKLEKEVTAVSRRSENIIFMGSVSNTEMMEIQSRAWLLVNPRPVEDPIARVTFPSKIFEYMASGTPVLTTKLNGFTEEYHDKMFFVDDNTPSAMGKRISEIAGMGEAELEEMAMNARKFVLEEKNWECQAEKIYKFLVCRPI